MSKRILLIGFPALLLVLLACERFLTFILAQFPGSPVAWQMWFQFRPAGFLISDAMDGLTQDNLALQAAILVLFGAALVYAVFQPKALIFYFLANHFALLGVAITAFVKQSAEFASLAGGSSDATALSSLLDLQFSSNQIVLLVLGAAACLFCHFSLLSDLRTRHEQVKWQLLALQRAI